MKTLLKVFIAICMVSSAYDGSSQIKVNLKKKIENQTNNRANSKTDKAIDKGLDKIEGVFNKKDKTEEAPTKQSTQTNQTKSGNSDSGNQPVKQEQTKLEAFSKYDFVPGDKIILYEDFSQDAVGDFPALWTTDVAGEINTLNIGPGNWLNLNSGEGTYWFMKDIDFPQNFIVELDIVPKKSGLRIAADLVLFGEDKHSEMDKGGNPGLCGIHVQMEKANWLTKGYKKGVNENLSGQSSINPVEEEKVNHVIVWMQNRRLKEPKCWMFPPIFMKAANSSVCVLNCTGELQAGRTFQISKSPLQHPIPAVNSLPKENWLPTEFISM